MTLKLVCLKTLKIKKKIMHINYICFEILNFLNTCTIHKLHSKLKIVLFLAFFLQLQPIRQVSLFMQPYKCPALTRRLTPCWT